MKTQRVFYCSVICTGILEKRKSEEKLVKRTLQGFITVHGCKKYRKGVISTFSGIIKKKKKAKE